MRYVRATRASRFGASGLGAFGLGAAVVASAVALFACSEDSEECEATEDCLEVVCPDGSKIRGCAEGVCLEGSDCPDQGGW